jgi:hypothetical protein
MNDTPRTKPTPVRGRPWSPGESGNPGGRPGGYAEFRGLCRKKTAEAIDTRTAALGEGGAVAVAAARVLLEYGWGRPSSAPEDLEAVREGNPLAGLTREQLLLLARDDE